MITPDLPFRGVTRVLMNDGWHNIEAESLTAVSSAPNQPPTTFRWTEVFDELDETAQTKQTFICPASSVLALSGPFQDEPKVQVVPANAMPGKPRLIS